MWTNGLIMKRNRIAASTMPVVQALEARQLMSAVAPGWTQMVGGCTLSCEGHDDGSMWMMVTGTDGNDVMKVSLDANNANAIEFELNGQVFEMDRGDAGGDWLFGPNMNLSVDGGAGNDRLEDNLPGGVFKNVMLLGNDGNDTVLGGGGSADVVGQDGITRTFTTINNLEGGNGDDLLVGRGQCYIKGDAGDDTIFSNDSAMQIWTGTGNDVVHGNTADAANTPWVMEADGNNDGTSFDHLLLGHYYIPRFPMTAPPSAGDHSLDAASTGLSMPADSAPATLVGDMLLIHGTTSSDTVHLWSDALGTTLTVSVNGTYQTFDASNVRKYAFDAEGGNDSLVIHDGAGVPTGWAIRTANPDDNAIVTHTQDAAPTDGVEFIPTPIAPVDVQVKVQSDAPKAIAPVLPPVSVEPPAAPVNITTPPPVAPQAQAPVVPPAPVATLAVTTNLKGKNVKAPKVKVPKVKVVKPAKPPKPAKPAKPVKAVKVKLILAKK